MIQMHKMKVVATMFVVISFFTIPVSASTDGCRSTATGDYRVEHFKGKIAPGDHILRIWLPPGYSDSLNRIRSYPVLYMMDGQNLFDICPAMSHSEWEVDESLTSLINSGKVEPLIVVGIDAPDDGPLRGSELLPFRDDINQLSFTPNGQRWPAFLVNEVLPHIAKNYRIKEGRASTAIGGASYGAIAALYALVMRPYTFGLGLIESPSATVGNGEMARLTRYLTVPPIRVSIGVGDREADRYAEALRKLNLDPEAINKSMAYNARQIADNLREVDGAPSALLFTEIPDGTHDTSAWRKRFPAAVSFLFPAK